MIHHGCCTLYDADIADPLRSASSHCTRAYLTCLVASAITTPRNACTFSAPRRAGKPSECAASASATVGRPGGVFGGAYSDVPRRDRHLASDPRGHRRKTASMTSRLARCVDVVSQTVGHLCICGLTAGGSRRFDSTFFLPHLRGAVDALRWHKADCQTALQPPSRCRSRLRIMYSSDGAHNIPPWGGLRLCKGQP